MKVNPPALKLMLNLFPWKAPMALARCIEWREIYRNRNQLSSPMLDWGCGDGEVARLMFGEQSFTGFDVDPIALTHAHSLHRDLVRGDARKLPFNDGSFSSICSVCVMEHLPEIDVCIEEISRVLMSDGKLVATVPCGDWKKLFFWNDFFSRIGLGWLGRRLVDAYDKNLVHVNLFNEEIWRDKFHQAGMELIKVSPWLPLSATRYTTRVDGFMAMPFPFPGFWTQYGTRFIINSVMRRMGRQEKWKNRFLKKIEPFYEEECDPCGQSGGFVLVARKMK